ncbi:hypothetical protein AQUCO_00600385v1 [Aquilegia coerulea]|uniref:Uncharacterized protein n=1 Tax=Aquilegia coerulea TaxID=218851 RepID=A0A2G5EPH2_AQUCA|nr:hypothetical protein AQUCO_00600385v1 [Aquilegia coerulea]
MINESAFISNVYPFEVLLSLCKLLGPNPFDRFYSIFYSHFLNFETLPITASPDFNLTIYKSVLSICVCVLVLHFTKKVI